MALSDIAANKAKELATNSLQNAQGEIATSRSQIAYSNSIEKSKASIESARLTQQELQKIISLNSGSPWPQTGLNPIMRLLAPKLNTKGFLPSLLLSPTLKSTPKPTIEQSLGRGLAADGTYKEVKLTQNFGNYKFVDWRGQQLELPSKSLTTEDRFYAGKDLPRENPVLVNKPHSRRDVDLIFGDGRSDYFRNSLQVIGDGKNVSNLTPIENPPTGKSTLRLDHFKETPWENEDPPMFGFDIIFDSYSSPLLNGSLSDFILNYSNVSEILSKRQVYEEFKNQFQKFFRINGEMKVDPTQIAMTSLYSNVAAADSSSPLFNPHKKNYLGHYLKKITGLDFLIEQNKGDTIKYTPDYKRDFITLDFREDVSMNLGTLAHLYKTLYWSKPNGKMLVPENLLRFNCIIIVSECRNFQRVKKGIKNPENINIIKDNLSRYVYTLRECQFYFDKMPLPNEIDMGDQGPKMFENYSLNFDFKYSSVKLERFVPNGDWGNYVGIDGGSIWKVGNKGTRNSRGQTGSQELSTPKFFTVGPDNENYTYYPNLKINGEEKPYIMAVYGPKADQPDFFPLSEPKSTEGTLGVKNKGTGGQNLAETGAGNDGKVEQGTTTTTGGGAIPGGGTIPTEGSGSGGTIDNLKKQSEQAVQSSKEQAEIKSVQEATSSQKKTTFGGVQSELSNISLNSVTKSIGTPLSQIVANKSISSDIVSGKFFDKMGSLKIEDSLKGLAGGGLSNLTSGLGGNLLGGLSGGLSGLKSAIPSLDSVKAKFSEAKTQAKSGFFDIRGNLKSSLTEGATKLKSGGGLFGGLSNQSEGLLGGLTSKIKSAVPSLDSVKTKFSEAKTQASNGFFDVRGNLKSSLTEGATKLKGGGGLFGGLSNQAEGLLGGLSSKIKSAVPDLSSVKTKFSDAKTQATSGFFDVRGNLKSSLTEGAKILTSFDKAVDDANSLTEQVSKKKNDTINLVKGLLNKEVEESKNNIGGFISVDNLKEKFTNATEIPSSSFFDVRGQMSGDKGKDTSSLNLRKNLLNNTIDKIYNTTKTGTSPIKNNTPPPTSFFDLKNQLKDFLGGTLGDKLTE